MKKANPITWVPSLYFAMGLPFVVLNMVCALMFRGMGISDTKIAFWTSLIMLPWTLKPFWSPLLEMFKTKKYWVIFTQIASGVGFGLVGISLNMPDFFTIAIAILAVVAFSGATHDIVADGVYMTELSSDMQAKYIGWQGAFYNLAKIVATGGLVYMAGALRAEIGVVQAWMVVMGSCGAILFLLGIYHIRMLPSGGGATVKVETFKESMTTVWAIFCNFFTKKYVAWYIAFIVLYRCAEGFVIKIVPLFLAAPIESQGLGLTEQQIGIYYGTFGAAAFVIGSILGGYFIASRGLKKALFPLCCVFNIPFLAYSLLAIYQPQSMMLIGGAIVCEYFGYGFGFVGLTLYIMQQVAPGKHQMAHYAFASGIMNLGVMLPGMVSGYLSDLLGYKDFFIWVLVATIPAFLVCYFAPFRDTKTTN